MLFTAHSTVAYNVRLLLVSITRLVIVIANTCTVYSVFQLWTGGSCPLPSCRFAPALPSHQRMILHRSTF